MNEGHAKKPVKHRFTVFDFFIILLLVLAGFSVYFSLVKPIKFSHLIKREDVIRYAEIEIILPDDLYWLKGVLTVGEGRRDVYGRVEWAILGIEDANIAGRNWAKLLVKLLVTDKGGGIIHYGKYTLSIGSHLYLINDRYGFSGRILGFKLLDEKIPG